MLVFVRVDGPPEGSNMPENIKYKFVVYGTKRKPEFIMEREWVEPVEGTKFVIRVNSGTNFSGVRV